MDKRKLLIIFGLIIFIVEILGVVLVAIDIHLRYIGEPFLVYGLIGSLLIAIVAVLYAKFYKPLTEEFPEFRGIITIVKMSQKLKKIREHLSWLFFSIFWAVIIAALLFIYFAPYNLFGGSGDSACYLLSALAQSQAAIVAIVITLTLVAVQLASQTYSPRVMDLFLKSFAFWILLLFYGLSIMYDFILLDMIPKGNINSFGWLVNFGVVLMAGTFSALFLYVKETIEQLKPGAIINRLDGDVRKELKSFYEKYKGSKNNHSPQMLNEKGDEIILPLIDITKKAIRVDDLTTARQGIEKLRDICSNIIRSDEFESEQKEEIVKHFTEHFIRISHLAFIQDDEDSVIEVAKSLEAFWTKIIEGEKKLPKVSEWIGKSLEEISSNAAEKEWCDATKSIIEILGNVYVKAGEKGILITSDPPINRIILYDVGIINILRVAEKKNLSFAKSGVAEPLKSFCNGAIKMAEEMREARENNFEKVMGDVKRVYIEFGYSIGVKAVKEGPVNDCLFIMSRLTPIAIEVTIAENMDYIPGRSDRINVDPRLIKIIAGIAYEAINDKLMWGRIISDIVEIHQADRKKKHIEAKFASLCLLGIREKIEKEIRKTKDAEIKEQLDKRFADLIFQFVDLCRRVESDGINIIIEDFKNVCVNAARNKLKKSVKTFYEQYKGVESNRLRDKLYEVLEEMKNADEGFVNKAIESENCN